MTGKEKGKINMIKTFSKIFFLFVCVVCLAVALIVFWAYFVAGKLTLDVFIITVLFCGYVIVFELYQMRRSVNNGLLPILSPNKAQSSLYLVGSLILGGISLYLGLVEMADISPFERKLLLAGGVFFLLYPITSLWWKFGGSVKYDALPLEKRKEMETRMHSLQKITPAAAIIFAILFTIFYLATR